MSKYKIVFSDYYYPDLHAEMKAFEKLDAELEIVDCTKIVPGGIFDPRELIKYAHDADAIVAQFAKLDKPFLDALEHCRIIARYSIGMDTVDLPAAHAKGIQVANVPDYCIHEVANHAAAHILNALRQITHSRDLLLRNEFDFSKIRPLHRCEEQTLCLLGFGHIARELYGKMKPFFAKVVAFDPYFSGQAAYPDVEFLSLDDALACADVISVHVPLMPATAKMLSDAQFAKMKDGAILVNTARGGLIDEDAMLRALDSGKLGYCGLDVLSSEDFAGSPFLRHENVTLTPHAAWCSEEALAELQRKVGENVVSALLTGKPVYPV